MASGYSGYKVSSNTARYLEPTGNGNIDVVNDMRWTMTPQSGRIEVPTVTVTEYQQTTGQILAGLFYFKRLGLKALDILSNDDDIANLYKYKYIADPTGWVYKFPFFSDQKFYRQSTFTREDGGKPFSALTSLGKKVIGGFNNETGTIGKVAARIERFADVISTGIDVLNAYLPGKFNLELPESWDSTNEGTTRVSFDLFNTGTFDEVKMNRDLAYILTYQNSPSKRNFAIHDPVCIYDIDIPDVCSYPACYISELSIKNLGNTRQLTIDGKSRIIPEAYRFDIEFTPLLVPTRQILNGLDTGSLVSAITSSSEIKDLQQQWDQATKNVLGLSSTSTPTK